MVMLGRKLAALGSTALAAAGVLLVMPAATAATAARPLAARPAVVAHGGSRAFAGLAAPGTPSRAAAATTYDYVNMGDSLSAGEGTYSYIAGTNSPGINMCHRSPSAYSALYNNSLRKPFTLKNVACSGATTYEINHARNPNGSGVADVGELAQDSFLSSSTRLVTITIGINDLGLVASAASCYTLADHTAEDNCFTSIPDNSGALASKLDAAYTDIRAKAPNATVAVLTYPQIYPGTYTGPCQIIPLTGAALVTSQAMLDTAANLVHQLNTTITTEASKYPGFIVVNEENALAGHDVCAGNPPGSARWVNQVNSLDQESLHPNPNGYGAIAKILEAKAVPTVDDLFQLHRDGSIWDYTGTPLTGWLPLRNNPATVQVTTSNSGADAYELDNTGTIWRYFYGGWLKLDTNPATRQIASSNGQLYQLHQDGSIWQYTGTPLTGWREIGNNPAATRIVASNGLFPLVELDNTGTVWFYNGTPITGWQKIDNNPAAVAVAVSDRGVYQVYQLHSDGSIWRFNGTPITGWQKIDNNPAAVAITASSSGSFYQLHSDGSIWQFTGTPLTGWQKLDNNPATTALQVADDNTLYQLQGNGSIWRYTGTPLTGWQKLDNNPAATAIAAGATRTAHR